MILSRFFLVAMICLAALLLIGGLAFNIHCCLAAESRAVHLVLGGVQVLALIILSGITLCIRRVIAVAGQKSHEIDRLNRQLAETGRLASIGEVSAGVAHELSSPLSVILTEKQILVDLEKKHPTAMDPDFRLRFLDSMEQIGVQIRRCKEIMHNLLRFARRTGSSVEAVAVNEFIKEILRLVEREARSSGIEIELDLQDNLPEVKTDVSRLQQVIFNLMNNAFDSTEGIPGGTVTISTRKEEVDQKVVIAFIDNGLGIQPEYIEKVFEPFFTTKPAGKGTGLGLSICRSTIERLGGDIKVRSKPGEGSEFSVSLPLNPPKELPDNVNGKIEEAPS